MKSIPAFTVLLLSVVATADALAQATHGEISGMVVDATGQSVTTLRVELRRFAEREPEEMWRALNLSQGTATRTSLRRCRSKKKGVLIGAAVGAVATVAWAFRSPNPTAWGAAGAGVGALVGLAYCTRP